MSSSATQPAIPKLVKAAADAPVKFKTIACGSSFSVAICDRYVAHRGRWSGVRLRCIENMGVVLDVLVGSYSTAVVVSTKKGRHAVYAWGEVGQVSVLEFDKFDVSISSSPLSPDRPKSPTSQFMNDGRVLLLDGSYGGATARTNTKSSVTHAEGFDQARHSNVDTNEQQKW
ncbi:hypothetical protein DYB31_013303 [Aphanomyces astaci]|uniref:Uncharacterized protein n=1 Tax=Aphanomyces astaci TaxID=112090 RepID=A0A397EDB1_APHAT|nr:hypothetical protein DYB31_013303 [Aphanomyces astaci]